MSYKKLKKSDLIKLLEEKDDIIDEKDREIEYILDVKMNAENDIENKLTAIYDKYSHKIIELMEKLEENGLCELVDITLMKNELEDKKYDCFGKTVRDIY